MSLRCRSCNIDFHDNGSLEVHYQYAHSNGGESLSSSDTSRPSTEPDVESAASVESANDAYFKFQSQPDRGGSAASANNPSTPDTTIMTAISPGNAADNRDFHVSQSLASHQHHQHHLQQQHQLQLHQQTQSQQQHHLQLLHLHQQQAQSQQPYDIPTSVGSVVGAAPSLPAPALGHSQAGYENFAINSHHQEYVRSAQNSAYSNYNDHRYHPYYKPSAASSPFGELPTTTSSARSMMLAQAHPPGSLIRCDKCDFQATHAEHMAHHQHIVHRSIAPLNLNMPPFNRFANGPPLNGGAEPQAEILDLDSHKVHVYQPPNGEDSPDEDPRAAIDPWHRHHQHRQQQPPSLHATSMQQQNGGSGRGTPNGRGSTPLPSPDFGSVSTTTDNVENLHSSTRSPYYEHGSVANAHISSTDNPNGVGSASGGNCAVSTGRGSSKSGKNTNGAWKSNEARRPKTYNCSACNKWFTSSGHLKRHYNTTLHKNAVKQSGAPDPATLPVSHHHHPQKDPTYPTGRHQSKGSTTTTSTPTTPLSDSSDSLTPTTNVKVEPGVFASRNSSSQISTSLPSQQQQQQQPVTPTPQSSSNGGSAFLQQRRHSPNLMAGPSEQPGGLLQLQHHPLHHRHLHNHHLSYPMHQSADLMRSPSPNTTGQQQQQQPQPPLPPHSNHLSFQPQPPPPVFGPTPTMPPSHSMQFFPHMSTKIYPNFQSPHVSTTHRVTTTSSHLTGSNLTDALSTDADDECADSKLPSFACLPKTAWSQAHFEQILGTLETTTATAQSNVGGQYSSTKETEAMLLRAATLTTTTSATTTSTAAAPADAFGFVKREPSESPSSENADDRLTPAPAEKREAASEQLRQQHQVAGHRRSIHRLTPPAQSSTPEEQSVSSSTNSVLEQLGLGDDDADGRCAVDESVAAKPPFSCELCRKHFNKACYLTQHNKSFHSGVKPYKCPRCGKRFPDADHYNAHLAKHSGDKPYKCDACPKAFNHKTDLRRHACLHTDMRPFSCDLCGKGFIRKDHMLKHRETHKNRKGGTPAAAFHSADTLQVRNGRAMKRAKVVK